MSIQTLHFTSNATLELVKLTLDRAFPGVAFHIKVDVPTPPFRLTQCMTTLVINWNDGPARDEVEEVVSDFQSLDWNPVSGVLEIIEHLEVTEGGSLQQIQYGVDYVLCEGPDRVTC